MPAAALDMLADPVSQHIHVPVKAIRGQTDMSNPGKTHHRSRSHQDRRPCSRYCWIAAERRSASVMTFALSGCFRDGVARVSREVKVRRQGIVTPRPSTSGLPLNQRSRSLNQARHERL
jgi:hypothetical protein